MSAWGDAARYFEAALAAADACGDCSRARPRGAPPPRGLRVLARSRRRPCLEQYELAIAAYRQTDDARGLARAVAEQTRAHVMLASAPYGALVDVDPLREALAALGDAEPALRAQVPGHAGAGPLDRAPAGARPNAQRVKRSPVGAGDDRLRPKRTTPWRSPSCTRMRQEDALESWEHSREHARRAGDRWLEGVALQRIPMALVGLGRLAEAETAALAACELGRETAELGGVLRRARQPRVGRGRAGRLRGGRGARPRGAHHGAPRALRLGRRRTFCRRWPWRACCAARGPRPPTPSPSWSTPGEVFDDPGPSLQLLAWVYQQLVRAHATASTTTSAIACAASRPPARRAEIVNLAGFSALVEAGDLLDDAPTAEAPYDGVRVAADGASC